MCVCASVWSVDRLSVLFARPVLNFVRNEGDCCVVSHQQPTNQSRVTDSTSRPLRRPQRRTRGPRPRGRICLRERERGSGVIPLHHSPGERKREDPLDDMHSFVTPLHPTTRGVGTMVGGPDRPLCPGGRERERERESSSSVTKHVGAARW